MLHKKLNQTDALKIFTHNQSIKANRNKNAHQNLDKRTRAFDLSLLAYLAATRTPIVL